MIMTAFDLYVIWVIFIRVHNTGVAISNISILAIWSLYDQNLL